MHSAGKQLYFLTGTQTSQYSMLPLESAKAASNIPTLLLHGLHRHYEAGHLHCSGTHTSRSLTQTLQQENTACRINMSEVRPAASDINRSFVHTDFGRSALPYHASFSQSIVTLTSLQLLSLSLFSMGLYERFCQRDRDTGDLEAERKQKASSTLF